MPGLSVVRPAGANETALAWRFAIASHDHPSALVFSRQGVPTWNPAAIPDDAIERGAYVLRDSFKEPDAAGADPDRDRLRGPLCTARRGPARGGRDRDPRREHAVHGALRRAGRRATASSVLPPRVPRARIASRRRAVRLAPLGRASRERRSGWRASARRRRRARCTSTSASRPSASPTPAAQVAKREG